MLLRNVLSPVALALTASAFLVPPHITDKATTTLNDALSGDFTALFSKKEQTVNVKCKSCYIALESGPVIGIQNATSSVELKVTNSGNQIRINGVSIYPVTSQNMVSSPMLAVQHTTETEVLKELSLHDDSTLPPAIIQSYSMDIVSEVPFKDAVSTALIFQILAVNGKIADIGALAVGVITKPDGNLLLHSVHEISSTLSPSAKQCTTLLCRVKATIAQKMQAFRTAATSKWSSFKGGCSNKLGYKPTMMPGHAGHRGPAVKGGPAKYIGRFPLSRSGHAPQHHGGHRMHHQHKLQHHRSTVHKVLHAMHQVLRHIVLPILIGVGAGMVASALGMFVGQMICMLWMRFRRSQRSAAGYAPVEQVVIVEEEGRLSEESAPPKYEDTEGQQEYTDEKKEDLQ